ncbi:MAG: RNA polymerase sigma-54 factor, partial [Proteobacteria bacterium]|nr:RNA polymerase sigma-54 factor [Pseudomonadota bacterium]
MGLELRQQLKLSQQLVMTPQLQQAIKLLQLSRLELLETVQQELMENPFLDETEVETEIREPEKLTESQAEEELVRTADWENYLGEFSSTSKQSTARDSEIPEEGLSFEARLASKPTLEGHLNWQMRLSNFTEREVAIGDVVVGNLDHNGYLQATIEEIMSMVTATPEEVESVIRRLQRLDPVGVGARTPQECLLVQMEVLGYDDPILVSLVRDHLEDLEKNRFKPLARKFKISMDELKEYIEQLQTLDPMPGSHYASAEPHYVSPDVFVY